MASSIVTERIPEEVVEKTFPEVRAKFLQKYAESIESGKYDERDVERIKTDDAYVKCFLRSFMDEKEHGDLDKPADAIDASLIFRKEININDFKDDTFPDEFTERNFIYWKGTDLKGRKMLHFKVNRHTKGDRIQEVKNFIAYFLEKQQRENPGERIVLVFNFSGAGVSNVDLDVVKFIITALSSYFPCILAYLLIYEMGWLLSAIWKLIKSWLDEQQKSKIHQAARKADLKNYVDESQIVLHFS